MRCSSRATPGGRRRWARPCGRAPVHRRRRRGSACRTAAATGSSSIAITGPHRLAPGGAASSDDHWQGRCREFADLVSELALIPVEGGRRGAYRGRASHQRRHPVGRLSRSRSRPPARRSSSAPATRTPVATVRSRYVIRQARAGPGSGHRAAGGGAWAGGCPHWRRLARLAGDGPAWRSRTPPTRGGDDRTELVRTLLNLLTAARSERLAAGHSS